MKRLVIVAAHSLVVEAVRLSLRQTAGFNVIGYANGANCITATIAQARPDVVLVDDMGTPAIAVERIGEVAKAAPDARILLLTMGMKEDWLDEAIAAGAHAVLCKGLHPASFATLVREVTNGNVFHSYAPAVPVRPMHESDGGLTKRELQILKLMAGGAPNGAIARELWVTEQTVKFHLSNIYRKLGVRNRTEAAHYAHVHRLLETAELAIAS